MILWSLSDPFPHLKLVQAHPTSQIASGHGDRWASHVRSGEGRLNGYFGPPGMGFWPRTMETSWNFWRKIIYTHPHSLFFCHDILQVPNSGGTKNTRPWHLVVDCTNAPISSSQPRRKARVRALGDGRIYVSWRKATKNSRCFSMEDDDYYNWIQIPF